MESRSLVSHKSSDSGLHVQLHPLVLLSISDHITRHAAQQKEGPVVGALLGQHNGREITLEHLFECFVITGPNGEAQLSEDWFGERLKQLKDVHKIPALDIVGWWSTAPSSGPDASHLPIHRQILQNYNESAVFLAFHPSQAPTASSNGSKLPLSVYESVYEGDHAAEGDKAMQVDGEEQSLNIRFRELPYFVETGEMEMIGIDTVARSARNAAAEHTQQEGQSAETKEQDDAKVGDAVALSHEEEEVIASLNTRLNAVRTLESRISLIKSYVATLSDSQETNTASTATLSHPILRNINSLLSHLSLLNPHEQSEFYAETLAQKNDVILVTLLGQLGQSIKGMRDLGRKAAVVSNVRQTAGARKTQAAMHGRFDGGELFTGQDGSTTPGGLFG